MECVINVFGKKKESEEEEQVIKISKKEIPYIRQRYPNLGQGTFLVKSITDINEFQEENKEARYTYVFQSQKKKEGKATVSRSHLDLSEVSPHINRAKVFTLKRDTIKDLFCPNAFYNICRYSNLKRVIFNETSLCNKNHQWVADDRSILHNGGEFFQVAMEFYYLYPKTPLLAGTHYLAGTTDIIFETMFCDLPSSFPRVTTLFPIKFNNLSLFKLIATKFPSLTSIRISLRSVRGFFDDHRQRNPKAEGGGKEIPPSSSITEYFDLLARYPLIILVNDIADESLDEKIYYKLFPKKLSKRIIFIDSEELFIL